MKVNYIAKKKAGEKAYYLFVSETGNVFVEGKVNADGSFSERGPETQIIDGREYSNMPAFWDREWFEKQGIKIEKAERPIE